MELPGETRAEVARRRLAQLAEAFEAGLPTDDAPPPPAHHLPPPPSDAADRRPEHRAAPPVLSGPALSGSALNRVGRPHLRVVAAAAVVAALLLVWWLLAQRPETGASLEPVGLSASSGAPSAAPANGPAELVVDVVGDVRKPGIVTVPRGSRVFEAIDAAGGLTGKVDTSSINLARQLEDGEQVVVGAEAAAATVGGGEAAPGGKVNLNTATPEQLDELPGVGPVTAEAIIAWRDTNGRFGTVDELLDVKGIGDATLAELRDLVTV